MLDSKALAKTGSIQSIENEILKAFMSGGNVKQETAEVKHADMSNIPLSYAQMGVYVETDFYSVQYSSGNTFPEGN